MKINIIVPALMLLIGCLVSSAQTNASAQDNLFLKNAIGDTGVGVPQGDTVEFSGEFKLKKDSLKGVLQLTATVDPLWHVFSITQKNGGPTPSTIVVAESEQYKVTGKFVANKKPHVHEVEEFDVPVEEHEGTVIWTAPIEVKEGVDPKSLTFKMVYNLSLIHI